VQLLLAVPPEYDPDAGVEVRVYDNKLGEMIQEETALLQKSVIRLGSGMYSLQVPYPNEHWLYALAWKPVEVQISTKHTWHASAVSRGGELLKAFVSSLSEDCKRRCRVSLFAISSDGSVIRTAHRERSDEEPRIDSEELQIPDMDKSALGQAIWGTPVFARRPSDSNLAKLIGFREDEKNLIVLPLRFGLHPVSPSPWGVVRVGNCSDDFELDPNMLESAALRLLTKAAEYGKV